MAKKNFFVKKMFGFKENFGSQKSVTSYGHPSQNSVTSYGHLTLISVIISTRILKLKLKIRVKMKLFTIFTVLIRIVGSFYTIYVNMSVHLILPESSRNLLRLNSWNIKNHFEAAVKNIDSYKKKCVDYHSWIINRLS